MKRYVAIALMLVLLLAAVATAKPKHHGFKPIPAKDVEVVKKITFKGPKVKISKPPHAGKPKKQAASGVVVSCENCNKYAIVIGISDYPGYENDLQYADDDAIDVYNTLVNVYGFNPDNIYLLLNESATADNIYNAVMEVKEKALAGDEVFFFFSGHGSRGIADDGDKERIDEAIVAHNNTNLVFIWDGQLKQWFSDFNTSRIVFAFDSCLAGGMIDLKADGRIIAMASTENGYSYEGAQWKNGEFTYYFFEQGMHYRKADYYPQDGNVTVEEAFDYTKANCEYDKPTISDSFENDLLP